MSGDQADSVVRRWQYGATFDEFVKASSAEILGELTQSASGDLDLTQNNAWQEQISLLKALELPESEQSSAKIYFEYTIPRLGRRADVILIVGHVLFVLEFKAGESQFNVAALDQVWDYALDLKNFHDASHGICIAPVLIATEAKSQKIELQRTLHDDGLIRPVRANADDLSKVVAETLKQRPEMVHVILTGRNAHPLLVELADTVTEMREVKHAYQKGILAQKGIEF